jgi:hypothetical protein
MPDDVYNFNKEPIPSKFQRCCYNTQTGWGYEVSHDDEGILIHTVRGEIKVLYKNYYPITDVMKIPPDRDPKDFTEYVKRDGPWIQRLI